ncbi:MAG: manganese-dependent inorganic pyrophosphatase [Clostridia bacterium]|jgi:manganese-dependent inorganic pyrophosphatase|nr:manganese-dependent inorganic pyrophosphatase PpaC [Clostridium sp. CAG:571]HJJ07011.1 manganese-dependent inorganic pyrophosphatase [Clostridiaceae bacterium]HJJ13475.1 manganese-dependent inorganic pyrophosphatase [Clostridiaceae bacterium]
MVNNKTLIFGHKNPDTDSIMSSMVMANLENQLGNEAIPVRLGKINKETEYVFNYLQIERPEEISDIEDGQNVILVDHNESTQSANNISNANILKVIDHHTMNFVAPYQLYYRAEPVGCTATVLYKMYKEYDVEITKTIATLMLSAIISDTLLLKSPTCTKEDKVIAEKLAKIAEVDLEKYGKDLLKAGTDISDFTPEEVINIDSKLFEKGGKKFKIAQINTADIDDVFKNKAYFETAINNEIANENLDLYVFAATDILNSNSKIISLGNDSNIVEKAYGVTLDDHTAMLENVVSRKKQMLPKILENLD